MVYVSEEGRIGVKEHKYRGGIDFGRDKFLIRFFFVAVFPFPLSKLILPNLKLLVKVIFTINLFEEHSIIHELFMGKFYDKCVTLFPIWLAPNVITFSGFFFIFSAFLAEALYVNVLMPAEGSVEWRVLSAVAGLCLFVYTTLDNCDGRQARRAHTGSALGELFDHSVDSMVATLNELSLIAAMGLGHDTRGVVIVVLIVSAFYMATFEEAHTGVLYLGRINGPNEGLFALALTFLGIAVFGTSVFHMEVPVLNMSVWTVLTLCAVVGVLIEVGLNIYAAVTKRDPHEAKTGYLESLFPLLILLLSFGTLIVTVENFALRYTWRACLGFGFATAYSACLLRLSHICMVPFNPHIPVVYLSLALPAVAMTNIIPLGTALWIYAIIAIASEAHFFIVGFSELADALGIKVFKTGLEKKEIL